MSFTKNYIRSLCIAFLAELSIYRISTRRLSIGQHPVGLRVRLEYLAETEVTEGLEWMVQRGSLEEMALQEKMVIPVQRGPRGLQV